MTSYYIDSEFAGHQGKLISMALVREDGHFIYFVISDGLLNFKEDGTYDIIDKDKFSPWVKENVLPILFSCPVTPQAALVTTADASRMIEAFLAYDPSPHIIADWPDDLKYFNELLITGPGTAITCPHMTQEWIREDAYPTCLEGAIQHNAFWDAMALKHLLTTSISLKS
jgi:hypothetical protein